MHDLQGGLDSGARPPNLLSRRRAAAKDRGSGMAAGRAVRNDGPPARSAAGAHHGNDPRLIRDEVASLDATDAPARMVLHRRARPRACAETGARPVDGGCGTAGGRFGLRAAARNRGRHAAAPEAAAVQTTCGAEVPGARLPGGPRSGAGVDEPAVRGWLGRPQPPSPPPRTHLG